MSNVCCGMFNVVVKAPDDLLTKTPNLNGNDLVIRSFPQWVVLQVHRTSHNRHSTFDVGCRQFFQLHRPPLQLFYFGCAAAAASASWRFCCASAKPGWMASARRNSSIASSRLPCDPSAMPRLL